MHVVSNVKLSNVFVIFRKFSMDKLHTISSKSLKCLYFDWSMSSLVLNVRKSYSQNGLLQIYLGGATHKGAIPNKSAQAFCHDLSIKFLVLSPHLKIRLRLCYFHMSGIFILPCKHRCGLLVDQRPPPTHLHVWKVPVSLKPLINCFCCV